MSFSPWAKGLSSVSLGIGNITRWRGGVMAQRQFSSTPILQYSNTPLLYYSTSSLERLNYRVTDFIDIASAQG